ncbi:polymeric immunoglobulin receptor-like [Thunnus thynnus]|uniref:polymeric immunoglobulin receptor-like n=1 Tax=Thunnus thynnus TaxID=8237 RepID=UPI003528D533
MSFIPHLILAGLIGIHCQIITVSRVSVKAGGSISIPCLYDQYYRNHVKFLCQGYYWHSCSYAVKTNQKSGSEKFSISDDTNQRIFTVTINDITHKDTDFWCAVEIVSGTDVRQYFQLSVTTGKSNLYVDQQEITASEGGSVTINCHYKYSAERKWCRLGRTCVTNQFGSIDGTAVTIDASVSNVFTVTMSKLRTESSGWYWCAAGDLQMPVHVTVNELPSTTMSPSTARTLSVEPSTAQPTKTAITGAGGESLQDEHKRLLLFTTSMHLNLIYNLGLCKNICPFILDEM